MRARLDKALVDGAVPSRSTNFQWEVNGAYVGSIPTLYGTEYVLGSSLGPIPALSTNIWATNFKVKYRAFTSENGERYPGGLPV